MLLDNLIYGTFPDLPGSQQVVHKTTGISDKLEGWALHFYNDFGDCQNQDFCRSVTVNWYREEQSEPLAAITRVSQQGRDFSGRWGALLRHTAFLTENQYRQFFYEPIAIAPLLVSSGSSQELAAYGDLTIDAPESYNDFFQRLLELPIADLKEDLLTLLKGSRLVLYSEINNEYSDAYLHQLVSLLPFSFKREFDWSQFLFRANVGCGLSLVYSGRYEAPTGSKLSLTQSGSNCLAELDLLDGYIEDYLELLGAALEQKDQSRLRELICDMPDPV
ncbi:MAG: hypothetical protein KAT58_06475 [candidate division Zixibacteria bacterium]|nr:hypothetical protein [candidate division Zixibacteria bacterium]